MSLRPYPRTEYRRLVRNDLERHVRVLETAVLRALTAVATGFACFDPHVVRLPGNEVGLRCELRHPEAVDHVGGHEKQPDRTSGRYVDLVRGDGAVRVARFPPPIVARDPQGVGRRPTLVGHRTHLADRERE